MRTVSEPLVRDVSDTARWAAIFRARESERPDAVFRDPHARRLAGERGERIAASLPSGDVTGWGWVARTVAFDELIAAEIAAGADLVVNLAAGLDARPYRMDLPPALRWVEVDLPGLIAYKERALEGERPRCALERVGLDLAAGAARGELLRGLAGSARRALAISEGLLIYLTTEEVAALAGDLAAPPAYQRWVFDLASPGLVRRMRRAVGTQLQEANAPLRFGPPEGPGFFRPYGWRLLALRSLLRTAQRAGRLPWWMWPLAWLPEPQGRQGARPWAGVCLMERCVAGEPAARATIPRGLSTPDRAG